MSQPELSVVVPAYNEAGHIMDTINAIAGYVESRKLAAEIIVVDDGSDDGTASIAGSSKHNVVVRSLGKNMGKGAAVKAGVLMSLGKHVLFSDADLSTPIDEADKLLEKLREGYKIAIASRSIKGAQIEKYQPLHRLILGVGFGVLARAMFRTGIYDTQCGFKAFQQEAARTLFEKSTINGLTFDLELIVIAKAKGMKVAEVPVRWHDVAGSKVKPVKQSRQVLEELMQIRRNLRNGKY